MFFRKAVLLSLQSQEMFFIALIGNDRTYLYVDKVVIDIDMAESLLLLVLRSLTVAHHPGALEKLSSFFTFLVSFKQPVGHIDLAYARNFDAVHIELGKP